MGQCREKDWSEVGLNPLGNPLALQGVAHPLAQVYGFCEGKRPLVQIDL